MKAKKPARRVSQFKLRIRDEDKAAFQRGAQELGITLSTFMLQAAMEETVAREKRLAKAASA